MDCWFVEPGSATMLDWKFRIFAWKILFYTLWKEAWPEQINAPRNRTYLTVRDLYYITQMNIVKSRIYAIRCQTTTWQAAVQIHGTYNPLRPAPFAQWSFSPIITKHENSSLTDFLYCRTEEPDWGEDRDAAMAEPVPEVSAVDIALRDLSRIFCHVLKKDTIIIPNMKVQAWRSLLAAGWKNLLLTALNQLWISDLSWIFCDVLRHLEIVRIVQESRRWWHHDRVKAVSHEANSSRESPYWPGPRYLSGVELLYRQQGLLPAHGLGYLRGGMTSPGGSLWTHGPFCAGWMHWKKISLRVRVAVCLEFMLLFVWTEWVPRTFPMHCFCKEYTMKYYDSELWLTFSTERTRGAACHRMVAALRRAAAKGARCRSLPRCLPVIPAGCAVPSPGGLDPGVLLSWKRHMSTPFGCSFCNVTAMHCDRCIHVLCTPAVDKKNNVMNTVFFADESQQPAVTCTQNIFSVQVASCSLIIAQSWKKCQAATVLYDMKYPCCL